MSSTSLIPMFPNTPSKWNQPLPTDLIESILNKIKTGPELINTFKSLRATNKNYNTKLNIALLNSTKEATSTCLSKIAFVIDIEETAMNRSKEKPFILEHHDIVVSLLKGHDKNLRSQLFLSLLLYTGKNEILKNILDTVAIKSKTILHFIRIEIAKGCIDNMGSITLLSNIFCFHSFKPKNFRTALSLILSGKEYYPEKIKVNLKIDKNNSRINATFQTDETVKRVKAALHFSKAVLSQYPTNQVELLLVDELIKKALKIDNKQYILETLESLTSQVGSTLNVNVLNSHSSDDTKWNGIGQYHLSAEAYFIATIAVHLFKANNPKDLTIDQCIPREMVEVFNFYYELYSKDAEYNSRIGLYALELFDTKNQTDTDTVIHPNRQHQTLEKIKLYSSIALKHIKVDNNRLDNFNKFYLRIKERLDPINFQKCLILYRYINDPSCMPIPDQLLATLLGYADAIKKLLSINHANLD